MSISEFDFAAMFRDQLSDAGKNRRLVEAVTGIFQRAELDADLDGIDAEQPGGLPLGSIMIDLDHFKNFNDTYGHGVGNEVLRAIAQAVATVVRGKGEARRPCAPNPEELAGSAQQPLLIDVNIANTLRNDLH